MILPHFHHHLRVAVIGATGGIGQAITSLLADSDRVDSVYVLSRSAIQFEHKKLIALNIDFNDEASIEHAALQIEQPLDIVINATGFLHQGETLQPEKAYRQMHTDNFLQNFMVNTIGPALVAKHLLPKMNRQQKNIYAILSARVGSISDNRLGGWYAYRASKAAINMVIKNLAIEVARKNKQAIVVGLHPGTVNTGLSKPFQGNVPEGKLFTPEYSAESLLAVIDQLTVADTGKCYAWDKQEIPA